MTTITWSDFALATATEPNQNSALTYHSAASDPWRDSERHVLEMSELLDDWDGLGAEAPTWEVVDSALELLTIFKKNDFEPPMRIASSPDGAIVFEWQSEQGTRFQAEVSEPGLVKYCYKEWGAEPELSEDFFGSSILDEEWESPDATIAAA